MSGRRKFLEECGKVAAACVFMAACEQEKLLRPAPCVTRDDSSPDSMPAAALKDVYIVDGFTGLQLGTKENPYSVRGASEFDALLQFLCAQASLAVHKTGRFKTKGVYRWGQYASRNLGKDWTVDGDAEVSLDPDAITDVDSQPLYCLAGPAHLASGIRTIGNHSVLADRWKGTLRTGGVLLEGDGAIDGVTFSDFGSLGSETFVGVVSGGTGKASISNCLFAGWNPSTSDTQVTVFMIDGERSFASMEGNETRASGAGNWVQGHTIYQASRGLVRGNRTFGARAGYYGDFWATKGITIEGNRFLGCDHGIQLQLSPTAGNDLELPKFFSHEDYTIGANEIESRLANVSLNTYGPSTSTRFIRNISVDPSLSLENFGATDVRRETICQRAA